MLRSAIADAQTLDAETVRGEAAEILSTLIESVTIYPGASMVRKQK